MKSKLVKLNKELEGELYYDQTMRVLYATDASSYREIPLAVAMPASVGDIKKLINFSRLNKTSLIPRAAGTSLAGQVVGSGIVVDISRYFNSILAINQDEKWVIVQPGVVRDELNMFLKPFGLFFAPETSSSNRAMIGGMIGNNACGSNSVAYGSTRDHLLAVKAVLSDGSEVEFNELGIEDFHNKCEGHTLESTIYRTTRNILSNSVYQEEIRKEFPKRSIERRNTGYALDILLESAPFTVGGVDFNYCNLIAGSEGTLAFITEAKLNLISLPPRETGLLCIHFNSIDQALRANLIALQYNPYASELIDHHILERTKDNIEQNKNRFFVLGDPAAILVIEFKKENRVEIEDVANKVESELRSEGLGYHFPLLFGEDTKKIWMLRKAGLGLLSNLPGDEKAVSVVEDTAVDVKDLPGYISEFNTVLAKYGLNAVHYAHAGSGELHLRPIINLKTKKGQELFAQIASEIATLVKKYNGSLSGEHGDGRLRSAFIPQMVGEKNYKLLQEIKYTWDPDNIFNPNKIVDAVKMTQMLRYRAEVSYPEFKTVFRFQNQNILQHAEQCNGSGDCRKGHLMGGVMCPSYMATRNEKDTTRARANILREFLTNSKKISRFDHEEIMDVMDYCLSCKGCKSECPSNVDVAKLKAEFLQQYYDVNGVPFRSMLIANFSFFSGLGSFFPSIYNYIMTGRGISSMVKRISGFSTKRSMPKLYKTTLRDWSRKHFKNRITQAKRRVYLFCDEFTNFNDTVVGIKTILLLEALGYEVIIPSHIESGRTWLSKGLVRKAKQIVNRNIELLTPLITSNTPLIGIEPSAILTFRDEYLDLADEIHVPFARSLASHTFLIDEFIAAEFEKGNISKDKFTADRKEIILHGHCYQKSLSAISYTVKMLSIPENYTVQTIQSGCCGMAGSFGYEREHYDLSQRIGELVLFPAIRKQPEEMMVAMPGTSCRHHIKDATGRIALHPSEILFDALLK